MAEEILCFYQSNSKSENGLKNKKREEIICKLPNCPIEFLNDLEYGSKWKELQQQFFLYLQSNFPDIDINDIKMILKAGRKFNYDFDLVSKGMIYKLEFKYNSLSLDGIPEFLNLSEKTPIIKPSFPNENTFYSNYFYENYLQQIIEKSGFPNTIPDKSQYIKLVYQANYDKHPMFKWLKEKEIEKDFYDWKSEIVKQSITNYLEKFKTHLDFSKLEEEFERTQNNKHYLMWYNNQFYYDYINPEQLKLTGAVSIKNGNTFVLKTKCPKTEIHMLLRWKNHLGILFPAYQIKLVRNLINK
jgi:hypothetical protein